MNDKSNRSVKKNDISEKRTSTFSHRLYTLMKIKGINQTELAERTGCSASNISRYLKGQYEPKPDLLYKLGEEFGVTDKWLMGYDVTMDTEIQLENERITSPEKDLLYKYRELDARGREVVKYVINTEHNYSVRRTDTEDENRDPDM